MVNIFSNTLGTCWIFKGRLFIFKFAAIIEILIIGPVDCAFHPCFCATAVHVYLK